MYSLDTMTHAFRALRASKAPPEQLEETSSRQFNTTWKMFLENIRLETVDTKTKWDAGHATNATGTGVLPHNRVEHATRFVAGSYILCGYISATGQHKPIPDVSGEPSTTKIITTHAEYMIDTGRNMAEYLKSQENNIRAGHALHNSIGEFYSLVIVALHETRDVVDPSYLDAVDKIIGHCEGQLSRYRITSTIPPAIVQQLRQAKFQMGVKAGRASVAPDTQSNGQQQAAWRALGRRLRGKQPPAAKSTGDSAVVITDLEKRREMLQNRAAKTKPDMPDLG